MPGKRQAKEALQLHEDEVKKAKLSVVKEHRELHLFSKLCTKFLCPGFPSRHPDPDPVFAKRGYRTLVDHKAIKLPEYDEVQTVLSLIQLQERYARRTSFIKRKPRVEEEDAPTPKEQSLLQASALLFDGHLSFAMIAKLTGLTTNEVVALDERLRNTGQIFPGKIIRTPALLPKHVKYITELIENQVENFWTLNKIKKNLLKDFNDINSVSTATISNTLHKEGYSYKKISPYIAQRNTPRNKEKRKKAAQELIVALSLNILVIFVDETSVKLNSCPPYGWGKRGEKLALKINAGRKSYTITTAITDSRVLGCMIFEGGVKSVDYVGFLCTLSDEYNLPLSHKEIIVFHDNAPSHIAKFVDVTLGDQITFIYNGPYSPMLNPIEEFFSKFKLLVKRQLCKTREELVETVQKSFLYFEQADFKGYLRHTLSYCYPALEEEDVI
jgi:transposase